MTTMTLEQVDDLRERVRRRIPIDNDQLERALDLLHEIVEAGGYDTDDVLRALRRYS